MNVIFEPDSEFENVLVVRLEGAFEVASVERVWDAVCERLDAGMRYFLFDFSDVSIITSAGIGMLVRLLIRLQNRGGTLAVTKCDEKIRGVFDIVMLGDILHVCGSESNARARLRAAGAS
jgi:anti-anti-sigma factor